MFLHLCFLLSLLSVSMEWCYAMLYANQWAVHVKGDEGVSLREAGRRSMEFTFTWLRYVDMFVFLLLLNVLYDLLQCSLWQVILLLLMNALLEALLFIVQCNCIKFPSLMRLDCFFLSILIFVVLYIAVCYSGNLSFFVQTYSCKENVLFYSSKSTFLP